MFAEHHDLTPRSDAIARQAADHLHGVLLPWLDKVAKAAGTILVPGGPDGTTAIDAPALVTALAALPSRGVAHPARAGALDLHHLDEWGDPTTPVPPQGIDVGRIVDQLPDATVADPAVLDGLRELADLVRQQLLMTSRSSQAEVAHHPVDGAGLLLGPDNSRLAITRVFNERRGATVLTRFRETGSCWFEIPIDSLPKAADGTRRYHEVVAAGVSVRLVGAKRMAPGDLVVRHSGRGVLALIDDGRVVDQPGSPVAVAIGMGSEPGGMVGVAPTREKPAFTLAGRAIAAQWSLHLPDGAADLKGLTAIEVQIDLEALVPANAITLRRISHPAGTMVPGSTAKATVELTGPATGGGVPVIITTTHPDIAAPHSMTVPAGAACGRFDIDVKAPTGDSHVVLTARTLDGATARVKLEIPNPPVRRRHPAGRRHGGGRRRVAVMT
jgi:hypothetical protein